LAVTDWRLRRWRLWFLALMTAPKPDLPNEQSKRLCVGAHQRGLAISQRAPPAEPINWVKSDSFAEKEVATWPWVYFLYGHRSRIPHRKVLKTSSRLRRAAPRGASTAQAEKVPKQRLTKHANAKINLRTLLIGL